MFSLFLIVDGWKCLEKVNLENLCVRGMEGAIRETPKSLPLRSKAGSRVG